MAKGDHIRVRRRGYWHHGIDCGDGSVIHLAGEPLRRRDARVTRTSAEEFSRGGRVEIVHHAVSCEPELVLERASDHLGETGYHLLRNNCEHFAHWCKTGVSYSKQVVRGAAGVAVVAMAAGALLLAATVARRVVRPLG